MTRLTFTGVSGARGGRLLFEGLSFALGPGDAALVTGPNGAGKSSLVRIAAGLLPPFDGTVDATGGTALLTEQATLDPELPLARALKFWASLDGQSDTVEAALAAVGLTALAEVPVRFLSTGQRRRAAIARVLASGAGVWLLDEPTSGLDSGAVVALEKALAGHRAGGGVALVATHLPIALSDAGAIRLGATA